MRTKFEAIKLMLLAAAVLLLPLPVWLSVSLLSMALLAMALLAFAARTESRVAP